MKKIIGIITRLEKDKNDYEYYGINKELVSAVLSYDCIILPIIVDFSRDEKLEFEIVKELIACCNGVILQGGNEHYPVDILIARYLYDKNIPTLGICLGMQIMAVSFEGKLKQIGDGSHYAKKGYVHVVEIGEQSKLYEIVGAKRIMTNSRHFEYITNTSLDIMAYGEDGIVESVGASDKDFFIGVQWHPESDLTDFYNRRLFDNYFTALKC